MWQELLKAEKITSHYGQWGEEPLMELHAQAEVAQDTLCLPWAPRGVMVLLKWLSWDPLRQPSAEESLAANVLVCGKGRSSAAEGEMLPGFPGVAIP